MELNKRPVTAREKDVVSLLTSHTCIHALICHMRQDDRLDMLTIEDNDLRICPDTDRN